MSSLITLTEEEKATVAALHEQIKTAKVLFADAAMKEIDARHETLIRARHLKMLIEALENILGDCALSHGVNLNDDSKGKWKFNPETMEFTAPVSA